MIKQNIKRQLWFSVLAFSLIALLFGLWTHYNLSDKPPPDLNLKSGTAFPIPREIKPFELKNAPDGSPFNNQQLKGHWSMLFFGFTNCAMLCPTTLSSLNQFYNDLSVDNLSDKPQIIFISIDPERDNLQRLNQYVTSFNKQFKGATGSENQLDNLTKQLNILFSKVNLNNDEDYQIDHSGTVLVFNPDGNLAALFSPPIDAKALAADYKNLIKHARQGGK